ncbi:hypothetical protein KP509_02G066800 [Ceratopteris richardii]|uniref:Uncharacterized protein n=1 Tax=Ceratopteris richardii TaxID=49495 RepID=A0A8T2V6S7_CERRI|nr:hypothetical protein KP509_02G066800 [Ceratopteris richardii]
MEGRKSFASALLHKPLSIPAPVNKPTAWESYLLQELKKLQGEMAAMKHEINKKDEQIARLQQKLDETQGNSKQTGTESPNKVDLATQLSEVVPFINLGSPVFITPKGTQARVSYFDMSDKIAVMKQAKSLQGTKVWIADELTPLQLKNRQAELTKVREARKNGKWAVYRGGQAIIRDFHTHTT